METLDRTLMVKMLPRLLLSALVLVNTQIFTSCASIERRIETAEAIQANGYQSEVHHVVTSDGYILEMQRIPYPRYVFNTAVNNPPVLVMHGVTAAANSFIFLGPEYGIAYNLADAGFDVWLANARGTEKSRRHVTMDPDNPTQRRQFFDFTWEEIGEIDLAAMTDYILAHTGRSNLHYIGHSQGGTAFLVLNSMKPEYNDKFLSAHLLAGVGYMEYFPEHRIAAVAQHTDSIYRLTLAMGLVEIFPPNSTVSRTNYDRNTQADNCFGDVKYKELCKNIYIEEIFPPYDLSAEGAATKQLAHYGQNIRDKVFRRWDYGTEKNLEVYNSPEPPPYDLSLITADVTMHYTVNDNLLDERDVLAMAAVMPNTVVRKVSRDCFLHGDFVFSNDVRDLVTKHIIKAMANRGQ